MVLIFTYIHIFCARFTDGYSKSEVFDKIDQMGLISGDTHTGHALEYCMVSPIFYGAYQTKPEFHNP